MSIVVRTLSERVFEIVREQIVTGQLPHDLPIRQDALAAELGVSKIPLREALARGREEEMVRYHIAVALNSLGQREDARAELERALRGGGNFLGAAEARALLRELSETR